MNFAGRRVPKNDGNVPAIKHDPLRVLGGNLAAKTVVLAKGVPFHPACILLGGWVAANETEIKIERVVLAIDVPVDRPLLR